MKLNASQTTHLEQRLTLTPTMRLALEVLQKPHMELKAFIEEQLQENPLLEVEDGSDDAHAADLPDTQPEQPSEEEPFKELDDNMVEALLSNEPERHRQEANDTEEALDTRAASPPTLHEHLRRQLWRLSLSANEYRFGELLIDQIDEHGYFVGALDEAAQAAACTTVEAERLLGFIQTFDPSGVGARDLRECLLIQLCQQQQAESLAAQIVRDHLPLFLQQNLKRLATICHRPPNDIEAACHIIRQLNPKPNRSFAPEPEQPSPPDLVVRRLDGQYEIELLDDDLPHLSVNRTYRRMLSDPDTTGDVRTFLKDRLRQALWFIRAIEQRNTTLLAIARCIISFQREFLEHGPRALKPLTQAQVAQAVGRHPSTVGRAIAGKAMDTPFGVIPLERFFASRIPQDSHGQTSLSDATIKGEIETLIAQEDSRHPLSDEAIATHLRTRNIHVARRTVAKYRGELRLLPTHLRRRTALYCGRPNVVEGTPSDGV